jgi:hypothetical protein
MGGKGRRWCGVTGVLVASLDGARRAGCIRSGTWCWRGIFCLMLIRMKGGWCVLPHRDWDRLDRVLVLVLAC